jgi:hypothetical protein
MVLHLPSSAAAGVRVSGASTNVTPRAASAARVRPLASTSDVDASTTISPGRAAAITPSSPYTTESTSGAPVTHRMTTSDARATSRAVAACEAPAANKSARRALLGRLGRTKRVVGKPFFIKFFAMPWPMRPVAPTKPMRWAMGKRKKYPSSSNY